MALGDLSGCDITKATEEFAMHAVRLLHRWSAAALGEVHAHRHAAVWTGVRALLKGRQLWLSGLGRAIGGAVDEKHSIKRMDRLLGNAHLSGERRVWYRWIARQVLRGNRRPVILVDWTDLDEHKGLMLLRAAVAVNGRALPVYEEVHERAGDTLMHRRFLKALSRVLGADCEPILVTDAGFRAWWFELVDEFGWSYVGRVRNREYVQWRTGGRWFRNKVLHARATHRAKALGPALLSMSRRHEVALYLYRSRAKRRVKLNRRGVRRKGARENKLAQRNREPWLLASNLERVSARQVVKLYRTRMYIEEAFRDLKAPRHGFAFRCNMGRQRERVANLLLLGALGMLATWLMGLIAQARGLHRGMQANTERRRRVLSVFFIGTRLLAKNLSVTAAELRNALLTLRQHAQQQRPFAA